MTTSKLDAQKLRADFAVFEELTVKQNVFAEVEQYLSDEAVLATNTSSLSVEQIGAKLKHPERLVGFHFFTPVAVMPLIEVVKTPLTDDATLYTAMVTAAALKKNAVITADTPGFVVNRVLAKVLGEAMHAVDDGTPFETVDKAFAPLGLPMAPSVLLDLVGLKVGAHVLDTHHAAFPDRFYRSENLHRLAEYGTLLEKDGKGKVKGLDKGAAKILAGGKNPWTEQEILEHLGESNGRLFCTVYGVEESGNWDDPHAPGEPKNVLHRARTLSQVAKMEHLDEAEVRALSTSLPQMIERRASFLTDYQDAAYAARYRALVDEAQRVEAAKTPGADA